MPVGLLIPPQDYRHRFFGSPGLSATRYAVDFKFAVSRWSNRPHADVRFDRDWMEPTRANRCIRDGAIRRETLGFSYVEALPARGTGADRGRLQRSDRGSDAHVQTNTEQRS